MINEIGTLLLNRSSYKDEPFYIDPAFTPVKIPAELKWIYDIVIRDDENDTIEIIDVDNNNSPISALQSVNEPTLTAQDVSYTNWFWGKGRDTYGMYTDSRWYSNSTRTTKKSGYPNSYASRLNFTMSDSAISDPDGGYVTTNNSAFSCGTIRANGKFKFLNCSFNFQNMEKNSDEVLYIGYGSTATCTLLGCTVLEVSQGTSPRNSWLRNDSLLICSGFRTGTGLIIDQGCTLSFENLPNPEPGNNLLVNRVGKILCDGQDTTKTTNIIFDDSILEIMSDLPSGLAPDSKITAPGTIVSIKLGEHNSQYAVIDAFGGLFFSSGVTINIDATALKPGTYPVFWATRGLSSISNATLNITAQKGMNVKLEISEAIVELKLSDERYKNSRDVLSILRLLRHVDTQEYHNAFDKRELYPIDDNSIYGLLQNIDVNNTLTALARSTKPLYTLFSGDEYLASLFNLYSGSNEGVVKLCAIILALAYRLKLLHEGRNG